MDFIYIRIVLDDYYHKESMILCLIPPVTLDQIGIVTTCQFHYMDAGIRFALRHTPLTDPFHEWPIVLPFRGVLWRRSSYILIQKVQEIAIFWRKPQRKTPICSQNFNPPLLCIVWQPKTDVSVLLIGQLLAERSSALQITLAHSGCCLSISGECTK